MWETWWENGEQYSSSYCTPYSNVIGDKQRRMSSYETVSIFDWIAGKLTDVTTEEKTRTTANMQIKYPTTVKKIKDF